MRGNSIGVLGINSKSKIYAKQFNVIEFNMETTHIVEGIIRALRTNEMKMKRSVREET